MVSFSASSLVLLVLVSLPAVQAQLRVFNMRGSSLPPNILDTADAYVEVYCGPAYLGKTSVRNNNPNPWWEEEFTHFKAQPGDVLRLEVRDSDYLLDDLLGTCQRPVKVGTHTHVCFLKKKGTLHYSYTLAGPVRGPGRGLPPSTDTGPPSAAAL
ncbi:hypothetical protein NHX12_028529 [Muraenolepis orangiensis]|uniref:C2 domain-containing protein n=1 Tax=Muraenolepis orangiensis TaxID=630683 RepID=A0A9Q0ECB7_9TELE|nr:hypothetical protein NHX12_028529 [Muraenolepis orangiensis]